MAAMGSSIARLDSHHYRQTIRPTMRRHQDQQLQLRTGQSRARHLVLPGLQRQRPVPLLERQVQQAQPHQPIALRSLRAGRNQLRPLQSHRLRVLQADRLAQKARPAVRPGSCLPPWSKPRRHCDRSGLPQVQQMLRGPPKTHRLARLPMRRVSHALRKQRRQSQRAPPEHRRAKPAHPPQAAPTTCSWRCVQSRYSMDCSGCRLVEALAFRPLESASAAFAGHPPPSRHPHTGAAVPGSIPAGW